MNIADYIERGVRDYPDRAALIFEGRKLTYNDLHERSSRAAAAFAAAGVSAGDRVALFLPNTPEFAVAYLGALKLGAITVSINSNLKRSEVEFVFKDCRPRVAIAAPDIRNHLGSDLCDRVYVIGEDFDSALNASSPIPNAREMQDDDAAVIFYTSGTTGQPKGATLSHGNIKRNIELKAKYLDIRSDDRGLLFLPLYHCFGQNAVLNAFLHAGATIVLQRRFDLAQSRQAIAEDGVTMFFGVPTIYRLFLESVDPCEVSGVRYYFSAAAPLSPEIEGRWIEKFGLPINQGYGLTETSPFASYNHLHNYRTGSIGSPIEGVEMKVVDLETGSDLGPGEKGEIAIRGHNVMLGYWNRPEETGAVIRDGWFHTGDVGLFDTDGYFFLVDRLSDMIISGGANVYPAEIENCLYTHPAVAEVAVYGMPEPFLGEEVWADVVLANEAAVSEAELTDFCREWLADHKVPAVFRFLEDIPKGPTGKILKRVLRARAAESHFVRRNQRTVTEAEATQWIHQWLATSLDSGSPSTEDAGLAFADLGMNSLLAVKLAGDLSDWLRRDVKVTVAWNYPNVEQLARYLATRATASVETDPKNNYLRSEPADALLFQESRSSDSRTLINDD